MNDVVESTRLNASNKIYNTHFKPKVKWLRTKKCEIPEGKKETKNENWKIMSIVKSCVIGNSLESVLWWDLNKKIQRC